MIHVGKWIARHRRLILILSIVLLIPASIGMARTKTNYDLLTYLPKDLETVKGQDIMIDEYGAGAFAMVVTEGMQPKQTQAVKEQIKEIPHVKDALWYDDIADLSIPADMLPKEVREQFVKKDNALLLVLLEQSTSSEESMQAVRSMRHVLDKNTYISGMTAILNDTQDLSDHELPIYVSVAVALSLLVLMLTGTSYVIPFLFLLSIGFAILYNMGSNIFLGSISYVTKAVAAVLQLGVTMDYSIFLLHSFEEQKLKYPEDRETAMGHAIATTFKAIVGSSVTTVAGFVALCFMSFTLGLDLGIVMAKGVVFGVISCVTVLPALVLTFDKWIVKTTHKPFIGSMTRLSDFITKHYVAWIILFFVLLIPTVWGNNNVKVYYDITSTLPASLPSKQAEKLVTEDFGTSTIHVLLLDKNLDQKTKKDILDQVDKVDGVTRTLGLSELTGEMIPESFIPDDLRDKLQSKDYEAAMVSTKYKVATPEINKQISEINHILKHYGEKNMIIGEGPLTKDLEDVTKIDFQHVNSASILIIFAIILLVFRSLSLPIVLELVIEFAIFINMAIPYFTGTAIPFVTSIILGTVQLGSTVDYAILMTNRYQAERRLGHDKFEAVKIAHRASMPSIITSGLSFFASTFGVAMISKIEVIRSICQMLARGALISTVVVLLVLPAFFIVLDKFICKTSYRFLGVGKQQASDQIQKGTSL